MVHLEYQGQKTGTVIMEKLIEKSASTKQQSKESAPIWVLLPEKKIFIRGLVSRPVQLQV